MPAEHTVLSSDPLSAADQDIVAAGKHRDLVDIAEDILVEDTLAAADILDQVTDIQVVKADTLAVQADILEVGIPAAVADILVVEADTLAVLADILVADILAAVAGILVVDNLAVADIPAAVADILAAVADILAEESYIHSAVHKAVSDKMVWIQSQFDKD